MLGNPLDAIGQRLLPLVEGMTHAFKELSMKTDLLTAAIIGLVEVITEEEDE